MGVCGCDLDSVFDPRLWRVCLGEEGASLKMGLDPFYGDENSGVNDQ